VSSIGDVGLMASFQWFEAIPAALGVGDGSLVGIQWIAISRTSPPCRFAVVCWEEIAVMVELRCPRKTMRHRGIYKFKPRSYL
jgi:hypothetical protein